MPADFDAYLKALAATPVDQKTEHTDRGALERVLGAAAAQADARLRVQHEPKRDKGGGGSPDYMVKRDARIVGYVEVKTIDEALAKILRSDQIRKYQKLSDNLLLTDYLEFIWLRKGEHPQRARLCHSDHLTARKLALKPDSVDQVAKLLGAFFSQAPQNIGRGQVLAVELAKRAALLRDFLAEELTRQEQDDDQGKLHGLYQAFRDQIFHELDIKAFADAFAQMLAYGLFLARLNAGANVEVTLDNVRRFIPGSFSLIRELVRFLEEMEEPEYRPSRWVVDEILSIVNGIDLASIHNDLSFRARKAISRKVKAGDEEEHRLFEKDPFIYFYEDFLKAYDPAMRKSRGVYYTPPPVVNFIVRAIDDILKGTFGITDGLADHNRVTVLDFATGTGTFLLEVFERIFDTIGGPDSGRADGIVREHLTKNIYGFEYLIAPYTIAHLKLSQYLRDKGHPLHDQERLQVFLTNTLEPVEPQQNWLMPELAKEVEGAQAVKDKAILVITGNPPYSYVSKNTGKWITESIKPYRLLGGKPVDDNTQGLQDDYVKFIRFAQLKMDAEPEGIVGVITSHGWLDNPSFRGMRQSLMDTFDQIHVLDLHGSVLKKERAPDGGVDQGVFDIEPGTAISFFVKKPGAERGTWRYDRFGRRIDKYKFLASTSFGETDWSPFTPQPPLLLFYELSAERKSQYDIGWPLTKIFDLQGSGMMTNRDRVTVQFTPEDVWSVVEDFSRRAEGDLRQKYRLGKEGRDWRLERAKSDVISSGPVKSLISDIQYRPFDHRYTYYTGNTRGFIGWPVAPIWNELRGSDNIALVSSRMTKGEDFAHAFVSDVMYEKIGLSSKTSNNSFVFPLQRGASENFSRDFRDFLDARYAEHYDPELILGYIYAVLHAPTYRARYAEFLRIDFPRIPFAETPAQFEALSALGWELIQTHLLKTVPRSNPRLGDYTGKGDHTVETVRYSPQEETIWINGTQGFANVPQAVWDFHIGGYQVIDKYLKSRRGRTLDLDEQTHVGRIAESLNFTIGQMARIDAAYLAAFPAS